MGVDLTNQGRPSLSLPGIESARLLVVTLKLLISAFLGMVMQVKRAELGGRFDEHGCQRFFASASIFHTICDRLVWRDEDAELFQISLRGLRISSQSGHRYASGKSQPHKKLHLRHHGNLQHSAHLQQEVA